MRARIPKHKLGEEGQSTVEFALTLILLMGFVLFYLQLSLVMAFGNYVHYATFMSARAYLSAGPSHEDQTKRAQEVIVKMLKKSAGQAGVDRFPAIGKGEGEGDPKGYTSADPGEFNKDDSKSSWMQGIRYTFKSRLFMIPMGGGRGRANDSANSVILKSESWLGREPTYDECQMDLKPVKGIFDNGC